MHLSLPKQFPLFILASSVCKSLQCLIPALTQGGRGGHLLRLTCSAVLWGERNTANKYHGHMWGVLAVSMPHWVCHRSWHMRSPGLHWSGCSAGKLSKAGPGLHALPRSKPFWFRFSFSGTPQRHKLSWACILCPSQVQAAQLTRFLASILHSPQVGKCILSPPPSQMLGFPSAHWEHHLRCAVCLLWGADFWLRPS